VIDLVMVDSGGANLGSVQAAFRRLGVSAPITSDPVRITQASHVVLPGVGAAQPAMDKLKRNDLVGTILKLTQPVIGVCVGMQLLFAQLDEGPVAGLGVFPGAVAKLHAAPGLRIPHMGWNQLTPMRQHPLLDGIQAGDYAYFVHSYAAAVADHTLAVTTHGTAFSAVVGRDNFYGAQFHPERSSAVGLKLLGNFLSL
jgi:imidazole glycerol-phosphate synthase subunit HisH